MDEYTTDLSIINTRDFYCSFLANVNAIMFLKANNLKQKKMP